MRWSNRSKLKTIVSLSRISIMVVYGGLIYFVDGGLRGVYSVAFLTIDNIRLVKEIKKVYKEKTENP